MINAYQEQIFYHYILNNTLFLNITKSSFFKNSNVRELFEIAKDHTIKYKEPPSKEQMIQLVQIKGLSEKYNEDMIVGLYNTKQLLSEYDDDWLENNVGPWIQVKNLDHVMRKAITFMKTTAVTAENASEVVEKVRDMLTSETTIDFSFNLGASFFDPGSHLQTRLARTSTGYDYIDICTKGGYWKGMLMVLFGMPKSGKSMWLCNLAAKSVMMGYNTAYITLELQEELVNERIGANLLNVPLDDYEKFTHDQPLLKKKLANLKQHSLKPLGDLHVKEFPSSSASANDISAYLKKAQEILGYKFDNIFIDYINIMKNWRNPNSENTYIKIKQISEDIRAMGQENDWSIITVTQTNRCISPDSIVEHREKGKIKIKDINEGDFILGNENYVKVNKKYVNKNTKTYKIKTKSGKEIICSGNHIFPVNNSLQQVSNIKVGDKIYIKKQMS
jgi:KaiC/GvpD/RAD55 family RecA-like ATPase